MPNYESPTRILFLIVTDTSIKDSITILFPPSGFGEMGNPILLHRACTASLRDLSHHCQLSVSKPIQPWPLTRLFVRPQTTNWHPTLRPLSYTQSLPSHQPTPSSVTQFLSNKVWQATHRSRIPRAPSLSGRARNSDRPPSPPPRGPWQQLKEWINTIPSDAIFWGILGLNGVVFCAWQFAWANYVSCY